MKKKFFIVVFFALITLISSCSKQFGHSWGYRIYAGRDILFYEDLGNNFSVELPTGQDITYILPGVNPATDTGGRWTYVFFAHENDPPYTNWVRFSCFPSAVNSIIAEFDYTTAQNFFSDSGWSSHELIRISDGRYSFIIPLELGTGFLLVEGDFSNVALNKFRTQIIACKQSFTLHQ